MEGGEAAGARCVDSETAVRALALPYRWQQQQRKRQRKQQQQQQMKQQQPCSVGEKKGGACCKRSLHTKMQRREASDGTDFLCKSVE